MLAIDQTRPQALILLLAFLFAANIVGAIWKNPETSPVTKNWATVIVVGVVGVVGCLVAFGLHWYPATDAYGVP